ncbi:anaerobic ribonucleoside-triphosphate reductase-activating protein [Coraliomargarita akajimensis]|uniref:Anaerobic ribonucleoside-triphosphate reductase-activating protein n=1 Tax=Coraliomargarita akajimensis (strain DSM 45221 / IAM 15411 / JCM 23193 / KCTC 12865 / 04OKA010-24) TaxID=583355 RepID=D5EMX4_CORAD|nr:anaerobic ribonucleoside-triphosphate reductase-activating protein [Coraliomargarita akajimensis]ADE55364.1 anaerobic ribonucleoside-triphosphate reductase activating protein [Coraliomargarita akajimensis DSM 45221]
MYYQRYIATDVVNGIGTRCTLFVSGCEHRCPGCYNASTWPADSGHRFTDELLEQIIHDLQDTRILRRGLSLTGGDPLLYANCDTILEVVRQVKDACPDKDIWLWTGYRLEELSPQQFAILDYIDVLIDGRFEQRLANPALKFRGSSNQRLLSAGDWAQVNSGTQQVAKSSQST